MLNKKLEAIARDTLRTLQNNVSATSGALSQYSEKITVIFTYNTAQCEAVFRNGSLKYIKWDTGNAYGEITYER